MTDVDEWERAWSAYVALLERCDVVRARARESRHHSTGTRIPRKALKKARSRIERLSPGFLERIEK